MAGVYIHIPFCAKKCFYCDFYVTLSVKNKESYLETLKKEIQLRESYLINKKVETIYFGGGTPSLLKPKEIESIIFEISKYHEIDEEAEITFEANPDDLTKTYLSELKQTQINRISIGIQSFFDEDLKLMNRRHDAKQSKYSISNTLEAGYNNITLDLIYGLPNMTIEKWDNNLSLFFNSGAPHLSAYHITYEPKTVFNKYLLSGKIKQISEKESIEQFELLMKLSKENNFVHYETSNFAKAGYFSRHNSGYWKQKKYLGIGTAAHSYDGDSRQNNIANIKRYISAISQNEVFFEKENLSNIDKYNDYLITSLRTMWGVDINFTEKNYGKKFKNFLILKAQKFIENEILKKEKNILTINKKGKFIEDKIIEDLFYYEEKEIIK